MGHEAVSFDPENSLTSTVVTDVSTILSDLPAWASWTLAAIVALLILAVLVVWMKGRPFAVGDVFRASRLSDGNRLLPTQVLITPSSVVQYTPRWIGRQEESIHVAHIASVKIETGVMLSDVLIETSGGASPIRCHGHHKSDAVAMKRLIERHQDEYYRRGGGSAAAGSPAAPSPTGR
jgi:hypothetical protein